MHFLSTTLRRLFVLAGLSLAWSAAAADPIEIDALTDDLSFNSTVPPVKPPGLEMSNGAFLHGSLLGMDTDRQELSWRVDGASAPLTFPIPQVRQITFAHGVEGGGRPRSLVKFVGGDWIAAEIEGLKGDDLQLTLADGVLVSVPRSKVEWIYFCRNGAPECYDGPTSFDGWEAEENWTYEEEALRSNGPAMLSRNFVALPDQVEYLLDIGHSAAADFSMTIQSTVVGSRAVSGGIRFILQRAQLSIVSQLGNTMQNETVSLDEKTLGNAHGMRLGPQLRLRIFEDCPAGRLIVYLGDQLIREVPITRIPAGGNRGAFTFQTLTAWQSDAQVSISRFCVRPWDGHTPGEGDLAEPPAKDRIGVFRGAGYEGELTGISPRGVRIVTPQGPVDVTCEPAALLRLTGTRSSRTAKPAAAHLRLSRGGEFDARGVIGQNGQTLTLETSFNQHLQLPVALLKRIRFFGLPWETTQPSDTLYFKNGDRLSGVLESANGKSAVQWRAAPSTPPVEIASRGVMGVRLAPREIAAAAAPQVRALAVLRNGDSLSGGLLSLNKDSLALATPGAGSVTFPRAAVKKLYFGDEDSLPALDGSAFPDFWLRGPVFDRDYYADGLLPKQIRQSRRADFPWRYFDGTFTYQGQSNGIWRTMGGCYIGGYFDAMPQMVELSFDVASERGSLFLSAQLFSLTPNHPGYLLELDPEGLSVFDVSPGLAGQVMPQRHTPFAGKLPTGVSKRHLRIFADRPSGRLAVMVDGLLMGQFSRKGEGVHFPLGRAVALAPQMNMPCKISNLWIGPWNGQLPDGPSTSEPRAVLLENGDQAEGSVESATATDVHLGSDLGSLDMPLSRISMINFGGESTKAPAGVRLRFAGGGMLTAGDWSIENGQVRCHTESAGDLQFSLGALQEIDLATSAPED